MKKFVVEEGLVMPLDRANVDTDFIIPKQFLKIYEECLLIYKIMNKYKI